MPDDHDPYLLTIGAFARAVGLSRSALRHYDDCGLLVPAQTDASTGYRYYTPALERRARLIARMRGASVPIETMRLVLDRDDALAREALELFVASRREDADRAQAALDAVSAARALDQHRGVVRLRVDGPAVAAALRQVRPAADAHESPTFACVVLDAHAGRLDAVASNRRWLARRSLPAEFHLSGAARAVLGLPAAEELAGYLDLSDQADLIVSDDGLTVDIDDHLTSVECSPLPFPSWRPVIEGLDPPVARALVGRDALQDAVLRAGRSVVLLSLGDGLNVAGDTVPAAVRGKSLAASFRTGLLLRAIGSCVGERVLIALSARDRPAFLASPDQPGYTAILMPTAEPS